MIILKILYTFRGCAYQAECTNPKTGNLYNGEQILVRVAVRVAVTARVAVRVAVTARETVRVAYQ